MKLSSHNYLLWIVFILGVIAVVESGKRARKSHRSAPCTRGCIRCDDVNGCLQCRSRMFLYMSKNEGREFGICKHECPPGYFGQRGRSRNNKCTKCEVPNCKTCFTSNYCTSCQAKFFLHDAECGQTCPEELIANPHTGKCEDKVDCIISQWTEWSKCARRSPSRSCKYGRKKRTRVVIQEPTENGKECPRLRESKKCKTPENECICEWNRAIINKWIQRKALYERRKMRRRQRRKGKKRGKKRDKRRRVKDNSTMPRLIEQSSRNITLEQTQR